MHHLQADRLTGSPCTAVLKKLLVFEEMREQCTEQLSC